MPDRSQTIARPLIDNEWCRWIAENLTLGNPPQGVLQAMVRDAMQHHAVDPARIYVAGLSAGGAMAAVLGQQYPDLFAAVGVHSGLVAGGAHDVMSAFSAMKNGAKDQRNAPRPVSSVPTIVFHGDADSTVHPRNGEQITEATTRSSGMSMPVICPNMVLRDTPIKTG